MRFEALIWKLSGIFLLILITGRAAADYGSNSNTTTTQPPTGMSVLVIAFFNQFL